MKRSPAPRPIPRYTVRWNAQKVPQDEIFWCFFCQAWTAVQVFSIGYARTEYYQLPLIAGHPTKYELQQLDTIPLEDWLRKSLKQGSVRIFREILFMARLRFALRKGLRVKISAMQYYDGTGIDLLASETCLHLVCSSFHQCSKDMIMLNCFSARLFVSVLQTW